MTESFIIKKLEILSASARHQTAKLTLESGKVDMHKGGGHYTVLTGLKADDLFVAGGRTGAGRQGRRPPLAHER